MSRKVRLAETQRSSDSEEDEAADGDDNRQKGQQDTSQVLEDCWGMNTVPTEFESISVPSQIVHQLLQKKENLHETILNEMHRDLISIQDKCSQEFETHGDELKSKIGEIREEIDSIQANFQTHIHRFNAAERQRVNDELTSLLAIEESLIDGFQEKICENEVKRTTSVKKTLKKFRKKLIDIAYLPPSDLDIPTDDEIKEYNEKIRNNHAIYTELCSHLHSRTINLKSAIHDWLEEIQIFRGING